ncbi:hypothetical protein GBA65_00075 [Rubrobacter marinus]|uniref:Uncharacterized protein n=1 Tax=Rubrobacter marinus TaxID=2653852 RepID=A0A6G8PTA6_9ACTN|nr:hypothetical protein [Rubrobacter marinus]QIN77171.1 hypothetical protein GBA65_00075 [Rubrobacter marinus]
MVRKLKGSIFRKPRMGLSRAAGMRLGDAQVACGALLLAPSSFAPSQGAKPFYSSFGLLAGPMLALRGLAGLLAAEKRKLAGDHRLASMLPGLLALLAAVLEFPA